jgi:ubiquitin carboxyl-terminal hydrolase 22/27/51
MLQSLHNSNNGLDSDCPCVVHKTFYGKLHSTVTCDKCKNKTSTVDPFMDLSLDLRSQVKKKKLNGETGQNSADHMRMNLEECLSRFTADEKLSAGSYNCRKCNGQQEAVKKLSIESLPPVLCVHLKV